MNRDDSAPADEPTDHSEAGDPGDTVDTVDTVDPDDTGRRRRLSWWQEGLVLAVLAVLVAVAIKAFLVQAFYIPSASMEPGLVEDDRILVEKPSYWFGGAPSRGDVVVFEDPGGWLGNTDDDQVTGFRAALAAVGLYPEGGHLVKRVIGVEGDVVECCDDQGRITVNGEPLDEGDYVDEVRGGDNTCNAPMIPCGWRAGPVPEGEIFVMGDNRDESADSTVHLCTAEEVDCTRDPFVDVDLVVGKVAAIVWPLGHAGFLDRPAELEDVPASSAGD